MRHAVCGPVARREAFLCLALMTALVAASSAPSARAQTGVEYRVLATSKTSTMEKELNAAAEAGFRFQATMGGKTAVGGSEVVVVMSRRGEIRGQYAYRLLATSKTSTLQKEVQEAAALGYQAVGMTVGKTAFGGSELVVIMRKVTR